MEERTEKKSGIAELVARYRSTALTMVHSEKWRAKLSAEFLLPADISRVAENPKGLYKRLHHMLSTRTKGRFLDSFSLLCLNGCNPLEHPEWMYPYDDEFKDTFEKNLQEMDQYDLVDMLHRSVTAENISLVVELVENKGILPDLKALYISAEIGCFELVKLFIQVNDELPLTPELMQKALKSGNKKLVQWLLEFHNMQLFVIPNCAVRPGSKPLVQYLVEERGLKFEKLYNRRCDDILANYLREKGVIKEKHIKKHAEPLVKTYKDLLTAFIGERNILVAMHEEIMNLPVKEDEVRLVQLYELTELEKLTLIPIPVEHNNLGGACKEEHFDEEAILPNDDEQMIEIVIPADHPHERFFGMCVDAGLSNICVKLLESGFTRYPWCGAKVMCDGTFQMKRIVLEGTDIMPNLHHLDQAINSDDVTMVKYALDKYDVKLTFDQLDGFLDGCATTMASWDALLDAVLQNESTPSLFDKAVQDGQGNTCMCLLDRKGFEPTQSQLDQLLKIYLFEYCDPNDVAYLCEKKGLQITEEHSNYFMENVNENEMDPEDIEMVQQYLRDQCKKHELI